MSLGIHGLHVFRDWPDAGDGGCCMGAVMRGPAGCTCWVPVYDREQEPPRPGPVEIRPTPCADCAFRVDSPERTGTGGAQTQGDLDEIVANGERFFCHDGMRLALGYAHPSGMSITPEEGDYSPAIEGGIVFRADGRPALLCAGWAARAGAPRPGVEPYDPTSDTRHDWKRGRCGRPYCSAHAVWILVDTAGARRNLCVHHARRRSRSV